MHFSFFSFLSPPPFLQPLSLLSSSSSSSSCFAHNVLWLFQFWINPSNYLIYTPWIPHQLVARRIPTHNSTDQRYTCMLWMHFKTTMPVLNLLNTVCSLPCAANVTGEQFHTSETVWHSILENVIFGWQKTLDLSEHHVCFLLQDLLALHNGAWANNDSDKRIPPTSEGECSGLDINCSIYYEWGILCSLECRRVWQQVSPKC